MLSDEMGLLGMKWDQEGFSWALENFTNQITEHPYSTAFTLASYLVPVGAAWAKGSRIAGRALGLAEQTGDIGAAAGKGVFGTNLRFRFDDHSRLVKSLAGSNTASDGRKFFQAEHDFNECSLRFLQRVIAYLATYSMEQPCVVGHVVSKMAAHETVCHTMSLALIYLVKLTDTS